MIFGRYEVKNEEESKLLAGKIALHLRNNDILAFKGDLGAGKSFLCRQIIKNLCGEHVNVVSPTYNLLQIYETRDSRTIYHFDLYRLKNPAEIYELGIEDALADNICLIEWPEIIEFMLPKNIIYINIQILDHAARRITII